MKKSVTAATLMGVTLQATYSLDSAWQGNQRAAVGGEGGGRNGSSDEKLYAALPDFTAQETALAASSAPIDLLSSAYQSSLYGEMDIGHSTTSGSMQKRGPSTNYIFATSESGNGQLWQWSTSSSLVGLAAGDAICQAEATVAGLPNPDTYVAWLSDDTHDAWCRAHGLSGKKSTNCGEPTLPDTAGPWVKLNGYPFGGEIGEIFNHGLVYSPVEFDPVGYGAGVMPALPRDAWTGTNASGAAWGGGGVRDCFGWDKGTPAEYGLMGNLDATSSYWTANYSTTCDVANRLICLAAGDHEPLPAPVADNYVFATDAQGPGVFDGWADAGGESGLSAADNICQAEASASGLANPERYVAWLSDSGNDAYCRANGRGGTIAGNCGLPFLPGVAGPWNRLDNIPFGGTLTEMIYSNLIYSPIRLDINHAASHPRDAWTGTDASGAFTGLNCVNWNETEATATQGHLDSASVAWTAASASGCDLDHRLICLSAGAHYSPPAPYTESARLGFVTSVEGTGELGYWSDSGGAPGIEGADRICQTLAQQAGLWRSDAYRAWISDSNTDAIDRFVNDSPLYRTDGVLFAHSFADLAAGLLLTSLSVDEFGVAMDDRKAWTGTLGDGTSSDYNCSDWQPPAGGGPVYGTQGQSWRIDYPWTDEGQSDCVESAHLYCFSDKDELQLLGFE